MRTENDDLLIVLVIVVVDDYVVVVVVVWVVLCCSFCLSFVVRLVLLCGCRLLIGGFVVSLLAVVGYCCLLVIDGCWSLMVVGH